MKAADTSASSAIVAWMLLTVVSRSSTTAEIDTFISDVSNTSTNIAIASSMASRLSNVTPSSVVPALVTDPSIQPQTRSTRRPILVSPRPAPA